MKLKRVDIPDLYSIPLDPTDRAALREELCTQIEGEGGHEINVSKIFEYFITGPSFPRERGYGCETFLAAWESELEFLAFLLRRGALQLYFDDDGNWAKVQPVLLMLDQHTWHETIVNEIDWNAAAEDGTSLFDVVLRYYLFGFGVDSPYTEELHLRRRNCSWRTLLLARDDINVSIHTVKILLTPLLEHEKCTASSDIYEFVWKSWKISKGRQTLHKHNICEWIVHSMHPFSAGSKTLTQRGPEIGFLLCFMDGCVPLCFAQQFGEQYKNAWDKAVCMYKRLESFRALAQECRQQTGIGVEIWMRIFVEREIDDIYESDSCIFLDAYFALLYCYSTFDFLPGGRPLQSSQMYQRMKRAMRLTGQPRAPKEEQQQKDDEKISYEHMQMAYMWKVINYGQAPDPQWTARQLRVKLIERIKLME